MVTMLMILQACTAVLLIISVLLQFGKGAEVGLMGGGASDAVLSGAQRGNILSKITAVLSAIFLVNSLILARLQSNYTSKSLLDNEKQVSRPLSTGAKKGDATTETAPGTTTPADSQGKTTPDAANKAPEKK